jgi:DGQHR domain-containing protein
MMARQVDMRVPAIEFRQGQRVLYTFAVNGKEIPRFAAISRLRRDSDTLLHGYQRPQILSHISAIRRYLDSTDPMMPNALVVAFDGRVRFEPADGLSPTCGYSRLGGMVIPVDDSWSEEEKPGWIVDGQQRTAAIRDSAIEEFPVCVTGFITESEAEQRSQFILVNSTKPLPKGLIYELLPTTDVTLPTLLQRRRLPAYILERLNLEIGSPFHGLIYTPTNPDGIIKDNSVLKMLENSLTDGALCQMGLDADDPSSISRGLDLVKAYWSAVRTTFPQAWGIAARKSRLMHGVGIVSMGFVMDAIAERHLSSHVPSDPEFAADLAPLAEGCRWTSGYWEFGPQAVRRWNELQNTPKDLQLLANHLLFEYRRKVLMPAAGRGAPQPSLLDFAGLEASAGGG